MCKLLGESKREKERKLWNETLEVIYKLDAEDFKKWYNEHYKLNKA